MLAPTAIGQYLATAKLEPTAAPGAATLSEEKLICRRIEVLGSRLRANRVCMTKERWADQRQQDRMLIERSQMHACTPGGNC